METVVQNGVSRSSYASPLRADSTELDLGIARALSYLQSTQAETGAWLGDYGGPLFMVPMYIGTCYGTGVSIPPDVHADMVRYLRNTQNADGGWGLHIESHSYLFTSTIIYAALRLSDVPASDPALVRARAFIKQNGGPLAAASWGKFFLALLNVYDYRGLNPVPPELWLLPEALPIHPSRMWCHARMVYLPMSYLYGARVQLQVDERVLAIRSELYDQPYESIDWESGRNQVAESDDYTPVSEPMKLANRALLVHEALPLKPLRKRALAFVLDQVEHEDRNTNYVCLGPVNKLYHLWVWHHARPYGPELKKHAARLPEYLYKAADGTKMQGYHSSQLWDTAFAVQAVVASGQAAEQLDLLERANKFIDDNQIQHDLPLRRESYRDPTKGGWGFSAKDNGWIVSDCTAEGLRAALSVQALVQKPMSQARLRDAVDYLLWSQMPEGGWASYEPARAPSWMEKLNVSNVFGDIMIDYPYVECSASAMLGLSHYRRVFPGDRAAEIERALERGRDYLFSRQREDGSFEGSWGICFTYGTWFGIEGLCAAGVPDDHERIVRACNFLEQHQLPDGGWGETAESNFRRQYVHAERGQAVMTSWALLGLIAGGRTSSPAVRAGVQFLLQAQRSDGSYPPEHIAGMFNKTCAIHYDNYLKVFPLWALSEARSTAQTHASSGTDRHL
ncbi:MAG: squalene--hopene cyclase [Myxococcaceae bacterium]|nr:squalene--hopene cyclase [Myxococcaceae bacterium]